MTKKEIIIDFIKKQIEESTYSNGDKIPSEEKLASLLKTSRGTVRVALEKLKFEGIIESKNGSGSYVSIKNCDKKYILLLSQERNIYGSSRTTYKTLLGLVEKEIVKTGHIPYTYIERKNNDLFKDISHILKNTAADAAERIII